MQAQNRSTLYATNEEISDNLDLRAVASIFGESFNLQDFERRLNDPRLQLSNLDLNYDNQVDYLRVIESVEQRTHVIIIQAVLGRNKFQDVASIDVERNRNNSISIQVVGDVFMYGNNYIYEPVYYQIPAIFASFSVSNYRPYCSSWNWNYYPQYYTAWRPFPSYYYKNNINHCINIHNSYRYVTDRNSYRAPIICAASRQSFYANSNPNDSFSKRNKHMANRYEFDSRRGSANQENYNTKNPYFEGRKSGNRGNDKDSKKVANYDRPISDSKRNFENSNRATVPINTESQSRNHDGSSYRNEKYARKESNARNVSQNSEDPNVKRSNVSRGETSQNTKSRTENNGEGKRISTLGNRRI